jgi:glycyl-tRNA synthetase beta chain
MYQTLLVELFTEELPPKALKKLGDAFAASIANGLKDRGLVGGELASAPLKSNASTGAAFEAKVFATPRRLAVCISHVLSVAADQAFIEKLMPVAVGLDKDGKATPALLKKLAAKSLANIDVATLERESDGKADQLIYRGTAAGQSLQQGLQGVLEEAIKNLPVPKVMSYQLTDGATTVQFVRPAHALMALHGANVVPVTALGLTAGRTTHGHRFQGAVNIELMHADEYESRLEAEGGVTPSFDKRKAEIESQLRETAEQHGANLGPTEDYAALLDEVTALVERPTVYVGAFETEFLTVPAECLILTMKLNQKYFPLFNRAGKLSNQFLIVSNMQLHDPHNIIEGNQRVVRPRLSDARFFFETDKKTKLETHLIKLEDVTYQAKLGSQLERAFRIRSIAGSLAELLSVDKALCERAGLLCKADLVTQMVGEFPELQGTMGRYYAYADGEYAQVVEAIGEHYNPRYAGDTLPQSRVGQVLALAEKLEGLVGLFGVGMRPTGDKDPFAMRRMAIGVYRILSETDSNIVFSKALEIASSAFVDVGLSDSTVHDVREYVRERSRAILKDQGFESNQIEAVISVEFERLNLIKERLAAVKSFVDKSPSAERLIAANKRIKNILAKSQFTGRSRSTQYLIEPAEKILYNTLDQLAGRVLQQIEDRRFVQALETLAQLDLPITDFFEKVMVMVDKREIRENRLGLLVGIDGYFNSIADLSKLAA